MFSVNRHFFSTHRVPIVGASTAVAALLTGGSLTWMTLAIASPADTLSPLPSQAPLQAQLTRDPDQPLAPAMELDALSPVKVEDHRQPLVDTVPTDLPKAVELGREEFQVTPPTISVAPLPDHLRPANTPATGGQASTQRPTQTYSQQGHQPIRSSSTFPAPVVGNSPVQVTHILPPSQGMMRINPLRLPAVPTGTLMEGKASWYGAEEHGTTTACMVTYDMYAPTLATRELPCGTPVLIIATNGAMATATTTDWGPAEWTQRRFDLSPVVFERLANLSAGVIDVQVVTLDQPTPLKGR